MNGRIGREVYPFMDRHIHAVVLHIKQSAICTEAAPLFELFYQLKAGFESLKEYNIQIVFPAVLSVFDTKDLPAGAPAVPVAALQQAAREKEDALMQLISELEQEAELLQLPEAHPVPGLLSAFTTEFANSSKEWHQALQGWGSSCACFAAARDRSSQNAENTVALENR